MFLNTSFEVVNLKLYIKTKNENMGRGDKKSRRGKIANRSFGARRPRKIKRRPTVEEKIDIKKKEIII
ncbi:30S ribosomal protein THX [Zobellia nedashkovskayae]